MSEDEKKKCLDLLGRRTYVSQPRETQTAREEQPEDLMQLPSEQLLLEEEEHEQRMVEKAETRRKQQMWNNERTAKLGSNPKEYRKQLRESLDQGFLHRSQLQEENQDVAPLGRMLNIADG